MIERQKLEELYVKRKLSMQEIASMLDCSVHKVEYWMGKHDMARRSIGDAIYLRNHPNGDPFKVKDIMTIEDAQLYGMGIGLYWGEGNKLNKWSIRLGNTDPELIKVFIEFLQKIYGVKRSDLRFSLQIFTDINPLLALNYWTRQLKVKKTQFYKTVVTPSNSIGTYKKKSKYGVVIVYYHNRKLRDILVGSLPR